MNYVAQNIILWIKFYLKIKTYFIRVMVFNATFNNISAISWQAFLLVDETGVPGENH